MSEESLENKKSFIRKEIEEKGYDLKDFVNYLTKEKSQELLDLEKIQFMEIQAYVVQFQAQNQDKRKEIPQQTEQTQQNQQNQQKKKIQRKSSKGSDEEEPEDLWVDFDDLKISNDNYYDDRSSIIKNELYLEEYKENEKLKKVKKKDRN